MKHSSVPLLLVAPLAAALAAAPPLRAQERELPPGIEDLPIGLSPAEKALVSTIGSGHSPTAPPYGRVCAAPEWEESLGVFCLWDNADLMDVLQQENDVYVITTDSNWWLSWLANHGIPSANFKFLSAPTNTWWVRDYGPWFMWDGNGDFGLVDNIYNRPRPLDDAVPLAVSQAYGIPFYSMDVIHSGGNYYADGRGTAFSSELVYKENPGKTEQEVLQAMLEYLGIWRYATRDLDYDIEHFDTFGKPVAPDTLVWGTFPEDTIPWAWSEAALKHYRTLQSPYGWPYKIHRMPLWPYGGSWTAYVNSLQTNDRFIVPKYGTQHDAEAQAIFEAAAPGYRAVLADAKGTKWGDSIHCRTRNFVRGDTIRIHPRPHWEATDDTVQPYPVSAEVLPVNGAPLAGTPTLYWTTTGGPPFQAEAMLPAAEPDVYEAAIPAQPWGTEIAYYLEAQDVTGRVKRFPLVAPDGTFHIAVGPDDVAPELDHDALHGLALADWPVELSAVALDGTGIPEVRLEYAIDGTPMPPVAMVQDQGTFRFRGTLQGAVAPGSVVAYRVVASDGATPSNQAARPTAGWHHFPVGVDGRRVLVIELDQSPDSGAVFADVCDDLALDARLVDEWPSSLAGYDALVVCLGMSPTNTALNAAQAGALAAYLDAGGAVYLEGGDCWAQDPQRNVYRGRFGVASAASGGQISGDLIGVAGEFTEGMDFAYEGEGRSADHLTPLAGAHGVLLEGGQLKALTYRTPAFRTVAAAFQAGGLVDAAAPSHAKRYLAEVLDVLGLGIDLVAHREDGDPARVRVDLEGAPGAKYRLALSPAPGYLDLGAFGVLLLDRPQLSIVASGALDAAGTAELTVALPPALAQPGTEVYLQGVLEDAGQWRLTNRDRFVVESP